MLDIEERKAASASRLARTEAVNEREDERFCNYSCSAHEVPIEGPGFIKSYFSSCRDFSGDSSTDLPPHRRRKMRRNRLHA